MDIYYIFEPTYGNIGQNVILVTFLKPAHKQPPPLHADCRRTSRHHVLLSLFNATGGISFRAIQKADISYVQKNITYRSEFGK